MIEGEETIITERVGGLPGTIFILCRPSLKMLWLIVITLILPFDVQIGT